MHQILPRTTAVFGIPRPNDPPPVLDEGSELRHTGNSINALGD